MKLKFQTHPSICVFISLLFSSRGMTKCMEPKKKGVIERGWYEAWTQKKVYREFTMTFLTLTTPSPPAFQCHVQSRLTFSKKKHYKHIKLFFHILIYTHSHTGKTITTYLVFQVSFWQNIPFSYFLNQEEFQFPFVF